MAAFIMNGSLSRARNARNSGVRSYAKRSIVQMSRAGNMRKNVSSAFDDFLDDFQRRKLGKGEAFYGARNTPKEVEEEELGTKENAVLVTGATGETGSWIVVALLIAGINVRVLTRRPDEAERMFGIDGSNVDVFVGDLRNEDDVRDAVDGASTIVCASTGGNFLGRHDFAAVDCEGVKRLVRCAEASAVKRFILLSCMAPKSLFGDPEKWKREGEDAVRASSIPSMILRTAPMSNERGGVRKIVLADQHQAVSESKDKDTPALAVSREDVAMVITNFLLSEGAYLFGDPENPDQFPDSSEFGSLVANVANSEEDVEEDIAWSAVFKEWERSTAA